MPAKKPLKSAAAYESLISAVTQALPPQPDTKNTTLVGTKDGTKPDTKSGTKKAGKKTGTEHDTQKTVPERQTDNDDEQEIQLSEEETILYQEIRQILKKAPELYDNNQLCPRCNSHRTVKRGHDTQGRQRRWCKSCKRSYTHGAHNPMRHVRCDADTLDLYTKCFVQQRTLRECARICKMSPVTATKLRHAILAVVSTHNAQEKHYRNHDLVEEFMEKFHGVNRDKFNNYLRWYDLYEHEK